MTMTTKATATKTATATTTTHAATAARVRRRHQPEAAAQKALDETKPSVHTEQADDDVPEVTVMESLCMHCGQSGTTKLMLTLIPYFREVILMSFECEHCGFRNSEVQFGGKVQEQGCRVELTVEDMEDLNRQVIKADTATVLFPDVGFEIPPKTQRGTINTIEGLLHKAIEDLRMDQAQRRAVDPEMTAKLDEFITNLAMMASGITLPFRLIVDDPAGNSHIENPLAPQVDLKMIVTHYVRTEAQDLACGLQPTQSKRAPSAKRPLPPQRNQGLDKYVEDAKRSSDKEVVQFNVACYSCSAPGQSNMCMASIPHFKQVIIMSFSCDACGFRTNEVKACGAIPALGERITLRVDPHEEPGVLNRDVLKSDSACVSIPEIDLELVHGSLGGLYTTIEGLLIKIRHNIEQANPFALGDSDGGRSKLNSWLGRLDELKRGEKPFTLIIEDPLANSFVYSPSGAMEDDARMSVEQFKRSKYEDELLGILDMNTDEHATDGSALESTAAIKSDKETMPGGGRALDPAMYHPNPNAVMETKQPQTAKSR
ncbi:TPA: hypothetical protein N0F65_012918 [Lagenidium giganteum]|uniref:Zinc finger ZPR1-type domain-containing protein n=1 Tax=Lagenidium giganteum TaxID=4803 RepID=A0AAV2YWU3_9STRA|nr:TPA: hypothetical protein N0F65_012918 [Lagenidium giganteum]